MARRKPIPERTIKALFAKSRNMCAFEGCNRMIVDETTNTVMGEIAHIEGVGKRSARHNPDLSDERLNDIENFTSKTRLDLGGHLRVVVGGAV